MRRDGVENKYRIIQAKETIFRSAISQLIVRVDNAIEEGWTPMGGVSIVKMDDDWYCAAQAMIKY